MQLIHRGRVVFAGLACVSALLGACFDKGSYKGGGRIASGTKVGTAETSTPPKQDLPEGGSATATAEIELTGARALDLSDEDEDEDTPEPSAAP